MKMYHKLMNIVFLNLNLDYLKIHNIFKIDVVLLFVNISKANKHINSFYPKKVIIERLPLTKLDRYSHKTQKRIPKHYVTFFQTQKQL